MLAGPRRPGSWAQEPMGGDSSASEAEGRNEKQGTVAGGGRWTATVRPHTPAGLLGAAGACFCHLYWAPRSQVTDTQLHSDTEALASVLRLSLPRSLSPQQRGPFTFYQALSPAWGAFGV